MNEMMPFGLFSFRRRCSRPSLIASLPTNSMSRILIFGPSLTLNVTFTSLGPPATGVILWLTSALVNPFSAMNERSTPSTRRMTLSSRNESSRSSTLRSRSFSSIFVRSICLLPW
jgi:hypothetical protein